MKQYILALDQGTTSSRAILFDKAANIVAIAQKDEALSEQYSSAWRANLTEMNEHQKRIFMQRDLKPILSIKPVPISLE